MAALTLPVTSFPLSSLASTCCSFVRTPAHLCHCRDHRRYGASRDHSLHCEKDAVTKKLVSRDFSCSWSSGDNWHAWHSSPAASGMCKGIYPFCPTAKEGTTHALLPCPSPMLTCQHQSPGPGVRSPKQLYAELKRQTTAPGREQRGSCEMMHCPALSSSAACRATGTGKVGRDRTAQLTAH